ncbi:MAG: hypothetical protein COA78_14885 [Blastopirellula sp.]|nr:MAG: hypothetical protein COA78_14885 [Blastopirellula sp.]
MKNNDTYEWNEAKRQSNLEKHGVDFANVVLLDWAAALSATQVVSGEVRILVLAPVSKRIYALVYTMRNTKKRIISFRKANKREVRYYVENKE